MKRMLSFLWVVLLAISLASARDFRRPSEAEIEICDELDAPEGREKWCYVLVRPGAHTFWWLYYTTHEDGWQNRPLIIWLQGGPGSSSTGYGNFEIIGPLDLDLEPRNTTWVQSANVLFVDNPVGAGYSYVESDDLFTQDVDEIAEDLLTMYTAFLTELPDFRSIPLYIFGQSYGGKMGSVFAHRLHQAITEEGLDATLAGFAMGNAWISPVDSTLTWGPLLYYMSNLDDYGLEAVMRDARATEAAIDNEQWELATQFWRITEYTVWRHTNCVDFYNILQYESTCPWEETKKGKEEAENGNTNYKESSRRHWRNKDRPYNIMLDPMDPRNLDDLMNGVIKEKLGIIPEDLVFGAQSGDVFTHQEGDFMKDVVGTLDAMLDLNMYDVIIYQGQLDIICDTKGALDFVNKLQWDGMNAYYNATKEPLVDPITRQTDTFVKTNGHFKFYWIMLAGHAVPKDNAETALRMLDRILDGTD